VQPADDSVRFRQTDQATDPHSCCTIPVHNLPRRLTSYEFYDTMIRWSILTCA